MKLIANMPVKVVTDKHPGEMNPDEATYIKNFRRNFNRNQQKDGDDGSNQETGTDINSTTKHREAELLLPAGKNKLIGAGTSEATNRIYAAFWNEYGNHGIYRINGDNQKAEIVIIDKRLNFSLHPNFSIPAHRWVMTPVYGIDENNARYLKDEIIKFVDGYNWQFWINTESCIQTGGYDAVEFPYYKLQAPHFDFEEFFQMASRPPMIPPVVTAIPRTALDVGKSNATDNKSIQFAYTNIYTDGRKTTLSPLSVPFINKIAGCSANDRNTPRCANIKLSAGSAHVEAMELLVKFCDGPWKLYDTIKKFSDTGANARSVIGDRFWLRTDPWKDYNYDSEQNTITYVYCGDKECAIYSEDDANRIQTDLPIVSSAMSNAGNSIQLHNNLRDYNNLDDSIKDKIEVSVYSETQKENCQSKNVNIKVYAYISRADLDNQFLYRSGENGQVKFGGLSKYNDNSPTVFEPEEATRFSLNCNDRQGFVCYLAGTGYKAIGKQLRIVNGAKEDFGVVDITNQAQFAAAKNTVADRQGYFLQEFEFNVPAGNYIARIAGHNVELDANYQRTSSYVLGLVKRTILNSQGVEHTTINHEKEIVINACSGDYDGFLGDKEGCFYMFAPYSRIAKIISGRVRQEELGRFITGYLTEDTSRAVAIEYVNYHATHGTGGLNYDGFFTDHNGFFFSASADGLARESQVEFTGKFNCNAPSKVFETAIAGRDRGFFPGQDIAAKSYLGNAYGPCNRILIKGTIKDCITGIGMAGIGVTLTGTQTYYTDAEGSFTINVHPKTNSVRKGIVHYNSSGECRFSSCDCSCPGTDSYDENLAQLCVNCAVREYPQAFEKKFKLSSSSQFSLKESGRYGPGVVGKDLAGRILYVKNLGYLDIPSILETGNLTPSKLIYKVKAALDLPKEVKWLSFVVTSNLNNKRYLQWVGDKIEFIDSTGEASASGNGAILAKITIQSLLDYNIRNNFSTTTGYQFVAGDKLRIYDDGKGNLMRVDQGNPFMEYEIRGTDFNQITSSDSEETPDAKSLYIDYDSRLLKLKDSCGFWMEIISPRSCEDLETYCETANVYPVINGDIQEKTNILNAFDTYYIDRSIIIKSCAGNTQTHPFLSSSVSDYWGAGCDSCGRKLIKDDNASQKWYRTEAIQSDDYVNDGRINGLGTFRQSNIKRFKGQSGGIVAAHAERGMIVFVCENDWFVTDYQQEFVKVTPTGLLQGNLEQNISNPNQKIGDKYGCAYEDAATIDFFDKMFIWADMRNGAVLLSDYSQIIEISAIGNASYFSNKMKYIARHDGSLAPVKYLSELFERSGIVDPKTKSYHLTFRPRKGMSARLSSFVNNEHEPFIDMQETFVFDMSMKAWTVFTGFTPEFYARLPKSTSAVEMFSFVNGVPYYHNKKSDSVNVFYGIKTDRVIETVFVGDKEKDKQFQRVYTASPETGFSIETFFTSNRKQFSYLPVDYFKRRSSDFYSKLMMNTNVYVDPNLKIESTFVDGGNLNGKYAIVKFVKDRNFVDKYAELNYLWLGYRDREPSK